MLDWNRQAQNFGSLQRTEDLNFGGLNFVGSGFGFTCGVVLTFVAGLREPRLARLIGSLRMLDARNCPAWRRDRPGLSNTCFAIRFL